VIYFIRMQQINIEQIKQKAIPVLKKYGVIRAAIFGSAVRGEMKDRSDIDILVELPHTVHGYDYIALKIDLQEELELKFKRHVDVVEYDLVKPELKLYIFPSQLKIL
jgi:predicted nucleotidyltransferase